MTHDIDKWQAVMHGYDIPAHMSEGLARWIVFGNKPGSFLRAVLSNNLMQAVSRADGLNRRALASYVDFLINVAPDGCWGTPNKLETWKGLGS